jgi:pilus assembly protein CpaB
MTRKLSSAFLIALLVSGISTFLLSRSLRSHAPVVRKQGYVAAAVPLGAGEVLKAENLKIVDWPASFPLQGAYIKPKDLIGRAVLYPIAVDQPILERALSVPGMGLTVKIPDGMRAVALRSDEIVGVAGFLFPGSHVDVLVTYRTDKVPEPSTATVLQDTEVLAAGNQVQPNPDGKPVTVNVVTLLMKPDDAERVVLASTQGSIHFVLRNGADRSQVIDAPVKLSELIPGTGVQNAVVARARLAARPKPYVVETVMGDKQTSTSFKTGTF